MYVQARVVNEEVVDGIRSHPDLVTNLVLGHDVTIVLDEFETVHGRISFVIVTTGPAHEEETGGEVDGFVVEGLLSFTSSSEEVSSFTEFRTPLTTLTVSSVMVPVMAPLILDKLPMIQDASESRLCVQPPPSLGGELPSRPDINPVKAPSISSIR